MLDVIDRTPSILDFRFRPPDRGRMWADLGLTIRQAAALTSVSPRQIQHWLDRGYLPASPKGNRRITGNALDLISLIHQARVAGIPLRRAVALAKEFLTSMQVDPLSHLDIGQETLSDLEEKLSAAILAIEEVRKVMDRLAEVKAAEQRQVSPEGQGKAG